MLPFIRKNINKMAKFRAILDDSEKFDAITAAVFAQVDTDGSGAIDRGEFKNAMNLVASQAEIPPPDDSAIDEAMGALNTDQSGNIDVDEFKVLMRGILEALAAG